MLRRKILEMKAGGPHEVDGVGSLEVLQADSGRQSWRRMQRGMWKACIFTPKTVNLMLCPLEGWCDDTMLQEDQLIRGHRRGAV